jgi:hypothetical protein
VNKRISKKLNINEKGMEKKACTHTHLSLWICRGAQMLGIV